MICFLLSAFIVHDVHSQQCMQIIEYNAKSDFYGLGYDPYTASGAANLRGWLRNSFFAKSLYLFFLFGNQYRSWLERETK